MTPYIRYINLPPLPVDLVADIPRDFSLYQRKANSIFDTYMWTDSHNERLNAWCQQNICSDMYFAFQVITGDMAAHKDKETKIKINYLLQTGGDQVHTEFFDEDRVTKLASYVIPAHKWHILKADSYHSVSNIDPGQVRFSITGRIF